MQTDAGPKIPPRWIQRGYQRGTGCRPDRLPRAHPPDPPLHRRRPQPKRGRTACDAGEGVLLKAEP